MFMRRAVQLALLAITVTFALPAFANDLEKAQELYKAKKYQEAESTFRQLLDKEPENSQAAYYLGLTLLELEKFAEAESLFRKTGEVPTQDQIKIGLARAYMGQEQLDKARVALDEADAVNPDNAEVYYYRGVLAAHRKDYKAAAESLEKATKLAPDHAYAHYHAGLAYNILKRPDKMLEHFLAFLKLAPDAPEAQKVKTVLRSAR